MRAAYALLLVALVTVGESRSSDSAPSPIAVPNDNRVSAGSLRDGVLTIALEAQRARWYPNGESMPGREVAAFGEVGGKPSVPGALIRVPRGTAVHATIVNSLADTLVFRIPATIHGAPNNAPMDSVIVPPGERRELRVLASTPGNYIYRANAPDTVSRALRMTGQLTGAIVVDETARPSTDRVMVITLSTNNTFLDNPAGNLNFAINGRSWPHTERLSATVGDTTRWRIINASQDIHPMHLHGFYFRVDDFKVQAPAPDPDMNGRMAVTQAMPPFSTLSMSWVPERAGNWLFHCHFQLHLNKRDPLELPPASATTAARNGGAKHSHANHAETGMAGLVMAVAVAERQGTRAAIEPRVGERKLRLLAIQDPGFPDSTPSIRFVIEENGLRTDAGPGFSPPLNLLRGQPVSITVVNLTDSATAVHWHGMELESYFDGVAGLSGNAARIAPMIAPRDSFEARFASPRAGTFMYHSHNDEPRTHRAGMLGAMIVREGSSVPPEDDMVFFLKASRARGPVPIDVNGQANPDTVTIRAGRTTRLRFIGLTVVNPGAAVLITSRADSALISTADSMIVPLRIVAKDGADLPPAARRMVNTRQIISMGETYDFELSPQRPGKLRLEVRGSGIGGRLLARVPLVVK